MSDSEAGRYFSKDLSVKTPLEATPVGDAWSLGIWFVWLSGSGCLIADEGGVDVAWHIGYDHDGLLAWRAGGAERVTDVEVAGLGQRWHQLYVVRDRHRASLWLDDRRVDRHRNPAFPPLHGSLHAMVDVEGMGADFVVFDKALSEDRILAHWQAGKGRF